MSKLKINLKLHKGRVGVPVERLAKIADEARKFLEMFANDVDLGDGEWIAERFTNRSLAFDNTFIGAPKTAAVVIAQKALRHVTDPKRTADDLAYGIRRETFLQYGKMASSLPLDDVLYVGLYNGKPKPQVRTLSRERYLEIERQIVERTSHYGGLQGVITALFRSSNTIWVHDISTGTRVVGEFAPSDYEKIWKLLESRDTVVSIEGWVTQSPGKDSHLKIATIAPAAEYQEGDLDRFFGLDPDFTGDMSTEDYLDDLRGETVEDYLKRIPNE